LNQYYKRHLAGCCSNSGLDLAAMAREFGVANAYDRRVVAALGNQNFNMATRLYAQQLISYNFAPWKTGLDVMFQAGSDYFKTVMVTPKGLPVDVTIKDTCGEISMIVTAYGKVVGLPEDMFAACQNQAGVTFTNVIEVKNT